MLSLSSIPIHKQAKKLNNGGRSNLAMISHNLPNQKQDTLQNKFIDMALTPSEIYSLRQDLKDAYKQGKGFFKERARRLQSTYTSQDKILAPKQS